MTHPLKMAPTEGRRTGIRRLMAAMTATILLAAGLLTIGPRAGVGTAHAEIVTAATPQVGTSSPGGPITRAEIIARAQSWVDEGVPYNQQGYETDSNGTYREDCSGYASMAWHLVDGAPSYGETTWTLPNFATQISFSELQPGDILDYTAEHDFIFAGWINQSVGTFNYYAESNPNDPTHYSQANINDSTLEGWPTSDYAAYRYNNIVNAPAPSEARHLYALGPNGSYVTEWTGSGWDTIGGPATALFGGGFGLFAVNPGSGNIAAYSGTPGKWSTIGGPGAQFVVNNSGLYGLGPAKNYVAKWTGGSSWQTIGGPATALYAGGNSLFATNPGSGNIALYSGTPGNWSTIGGPGAQFAANDSGLYGLGPGKNYVAKWMGGSSWQTIGGPATALYAGGNRLFATNPGSGNIALYSGTPGNWSTVGGPGAQFAVTLTDLFGLGPARNYVARWTGGTSWATVGGGAADIVAGP